MKIGAQLYTVRQYTQNEGDFAETIRKIAAIGYRYAQFSGAGPIPAKTVADICAGHGVEIVITHTNPVRIKNDTEAVIEDHKVMGAAYVGIGSMPGEYHGDADGAKRFIADFKPAARAIKAAGLMLMYHNHDFEFEKLDGKLLMDYLIDGFAPDELGFTYDTFWVQAGGGDPAQWLTRLKGRADVVHFKDFALCKGERRMAEVMEGNLNWPAIFDACRTAGVKWAMVEQDDCYGKDPFDCLRTSYNNLMEVMD